MALPVGQALGDQFGTIVYGAVICAAGIGLLLVGARQPQPAYRILTQDPLSVRDLSTQGGAVEVRGKAVPDEGQTVVAPFTGTECLAYEYEAQELKSTGQSSYWETLDEGSRSVPFLLEDETGRARVDPTGATIELEDHTLRVRPGDEVPDRIEHYIQEVDQVDRSTGSVNLVITEIDHGDDLRFIERRLDVGETAHIYGGVEPGATGEWGSGLLDVIVTEDETSGTYVISDSTEKRVAWYAGKRALIPVVAGLVGVLAGLAVVVAGLV